MTTNACIVIHTDDVLPSAYHVIWFFLQKGKLEVPHFTAAPFRKPRAQSAKAKIAFDPIAFVDAPIVGNAFLLNIFQSDIIRFLFCHCSLSCSLLIRTHPLASTLCRRTTPLSRRGRGIDRIPRTAVMRPRSAAAPRSALPLHIPARTQLQDHFFNLLAACDGKASLVPDE
jgi:hypothetical protein